MQIKNNYEKDVFNGDVGVVAEMDEERDHYSSFEPQLL
jgi:ATP-dependent exoDNAse (exonuclease V) alpha subunit